MKKIIYIIIALCATGIGAYFGYAASREPAQQYSINLGTDGFEPGTITVHKDDTVVFKTTAGKPFWPASDLHPSHTIYSEFDPKMPIEASSFWSFKFDKKGSWKFHDHLFPLYRGMIIVK